MRTALASFAAACLAAACALGGGGALEEGGPGVMRAGAPSPAAALALARAPSATKRDIEAALGPANVIAFDSGWQVWVYRWPGAGRGTDAAHEVVILFDAAGRLRKVRERTPA